jgi:hypothetical protein
MATSSKSAPKFNALLEFTRKSVPQIITESQGIVQGMSNNPWFPNPPVALATVTTAINSVIAAQTAAQTRAKGTVAAMHAQVQALEIYLRQLANYASSVANQNPANGQAILAGANFFQRKKPVNPNNGYRVHATKVPGQLFIMTVRVLRASYEFEMTTDTTNPASWTNIYKGTKCKFIKTGLTSGTRYYIRVKTVTVNGESAPSDVLSSVVL